MDLSIIQSKIYEIRGFRVMLDFDLAEIYQVENKNLKRAVRRNIERFPNDFMFELTKEEYDFLRYNFVTSNLDDTVGEKRGGTRYMPFAFTEQGVAQLSSVLNSPYAISVNISIIRAFVVLRQYLIGYAELKQQLEEYQLSTTMQIAEILDIINEMSERQKVIDRPRNPIGFKGT